MKFKIGLLANLLMVPLALSYQTAISGDTEAYVAAKCQELLGSGARLIAVGHYTKTVPGKVGGHTFHYVEGTCSLPGADADAANALSEALQSSDSQVLGLAVSGLRTLGFHTQPILSRATKALDISLVPVANALMSFIAEGKAEAVPLLQQRLNDEPDVRYKATYTLYIIAMNGESASLEPLLPELEKLYSEKIPDSVLEGPDVHGTKLNIVRIVSELGEKAPETLLKKFAEDQEDVLFADRHTWVAYEGEGTLGRVFVDSFGKLGRVAVPILEAALLKNHGGPYLNNDSFLLQAAEKMGRAGKVLIPTLKKILAEGTSPCPERVQKAIDYLNAQ